jgi:hypothetical protein
LGSFCQIRNQVEATASQKREKLVALPTFHRGGTLVDIADRNALYQAMEGR